MLLTSLFALVLLSCAQADRTATGDAPIALASEEGFDAERVSDLLPDSDAPSTRELGGGGRSDVEAEKARPFLGYFYPKPEKPFHLPEFRTVNSDASVASFAGEESFEEVERPQRSPRRRPPYHRPGFFPPSSNDVPPFIPGFIPPNNIRPLPALYGQGYQ